MIGRAIFLIDLRKETVENLYDARAFWVVWDVTHLSQGQRYNSNSILLTKHHVINSTDSKADGKKRKEPRPGYGGAHL